MTDQSNGGLFVVELEERDEILASWAFGDEAVAEEQVRVAEAAIPTGGHQDCCVRMYQLQPEVGVVAVVRVFSAMIHDVKFAQRALAMVQQRGSGIAPGRGVTVEKFVFGAEAEEAVSYGEMPWVVEDLRGKWIYGLNRTRVDELADKLGARVRAEAETAG